VSKAFLLHQVQLHILLEYVLNTVLALFMERSVLFRHLVQAHRLVQIVLPLVAFTRDVVVLVLHGLVRLGFLQSSFLVLAVNLAILPQEAALEIIWQLRLLHLLHLFLFFTF
jgi:hypothetical protein